MKPIIKLPSAFAERAPAERKLERREAYELLQQMVVDRFFWGDTPLDDLVREEDIPGSHGGKRAVHELRYYTHSINEVGVVGVVSPPHFMHHLVGIPIHIIRQYLKAEQPGCEWWIVAFQVEVRDLRRTHEYWADHVVDSRALERAASGGRVFGEAAPNVRPQDFANQDPDATEPVAAGPVARVAEESDYQIVLHMAWADVRRSRLQDSVTYLQQQYGKDGADPSFMREYARTQNIDVLSEGARMNRELAKAVIRLFADEQRLLQAEAQRIGTTDDEPVTPPPARVRAAPTARAELDESKRDRILALRAQGMPPAAIAKAVRVKTDKVIEVLNAAAGSEG